MDSVKVEGPGCGAAVSGAVVGPGVGEAEGVVCMEDVAVSAPRASYSSGWTVMSTISVTITIKKGTTTPIAAFRRAERVRLPGWGGAVVVVRRLSHGATVKK